MSRIVALVALAIMLMVAVPAIQSASESAKTDNTIQNETWTPDAGNVTELNYSNLAYADYDDTVAVYGENGKEAVAGEDYRWYESNGTIKALTGGKLDGDASADITYGYLKSTESQQMAADTSMELVSVAGYLPFVLAIVMLIGAAGMLGGS